MSQSPSSVDELEAHSRTSSQVPNAHDSTGIEAALRSGSHGAVPPAIVAGMIGLAEKHVRDTIKLMDRYRSRGSPADQVLAGSPRETSSRMQQAKAASDRAIAWEKRLSIRDAFKAFFCAVGFSLLVSLSCIMEGYDMVILTGFYSVAIFKRDFGCLGPHDHNFRDCEVPAGWQMGILLAAMFGQCLGLFLNGYLVDGCGYKKTFAGSLVVMKCFIFIPFFSTSYISFCVGIFFCGIPWGIFQTLATTYSSEVCPAKIRPFVTSWTSLCWILGQMLGALVQFGVFNLPNKWAYKIPLALMWVWPPLILSGLWWAPESPGWLIRKNRLEAAREEVEKLTIKKWLPEGYSAEDHFFMVWHNNEIEKENSPNSEGNISYLDCFKGTDRRRTILCCIIWSVQNASGASLTQFSSYFFIKAGLDPSMAFMLTIVQYGIGVAGTCCGWYLISTLSRRQVYIGGLSGLLVTLFGIGIIAVIPLDPQLTGWIVGGFLLCFMGIFAGTISLVTYALVAELPSTRLKAKTVNLARACYTIVGMINVVITPYMLNTKSGGGWGAKSGWVFFGITIICMIYAYFNLPDCKDLPPEIVNELFTQRISARKFQKKGREALGESEPDVEARTTTFGFIKDMVQHIENIITGGTAGRDANPDPTSPENHAPKPKRTDSSTTSFSKASPPVPNRSHSATTSGSDTMGPESNLVEDSVLELTDRESVAASLSVPAATYVPLK